MTRAFRRTERLDQVTSPLRLTNRRLVDGVIIYARRGSRSKQKLSGPQAVNRSIFEIRPGTWWNSLRRACGGWTDFARSILEFGHDERGVVAAEAEGVVHRDAHFLFPGNVRRVVKIAF